MKELVLKLGLEGAGVRIYRTPSDSGGSQFHAEGASMDSDENDDEIWRSWALPPCPTIESALRGVGNEHPWILFHPIEVHEEFRSLIWSLAQEAARSLPTMFEGRWSRQRLRWKRLCDELS